MPTRIWPQLGEVLSREKLLDDPAVWYMGQLARSILNPKPEVWQNILKTANNYQIRQGVDLTIYEA